MPVFGGECLCQWLVENVYVSGWWRMSMSVVGGECLCQWLVENVYVCVWWRMTMPVVGRECLCLCLVEMSMSVFGGECLWRTSGASYSDSSVSTFIFFLNCILYNMCVIIMSKHCYGILPSVLHSYNDILDK